MESPSGGMVCGWRLSCKLLLMQLGSLGFGFYLHGHWCMEEWPDDWMAAGVNWDLIFLKFFTSSHCHFAVGG